MKSRFTKATGYLYFHIRNDTGEIFYVGVGTDNRNFKRAKSKSGRGKYWKRVVDKAGYTIEIIFKDMPIAWILTKEVEFIALYGRSDLKRGPLVNHTGGGEREIGYIPSQNQRKRQAEITAKDFEILSPKGEIIKGKNLREFCRQNNLSDSALNRVIAGKQGEHKGYKSVNPDFHKIPKVHRLLSPNNTLFLTNNIPQFCRENRLSVRGIHRVLSKAIPHYFGWHLEEMNKESSNLLYRYLNDLENCSKSFSLIDPNGYIIYSENVAKFCRENNLNHNSILNVIAGKSPAHRGFKSTNPDFWKDVDKR